MWANNGGRQLIEKLKTDATTNIGSNRKDTKESDKSTTTKVMLKSKFELNNTLTEDKCRFCKVLMPHILVCKKCGISLFDICIECHELDSHKRECADCGKLLADDETGSLCTECCRLDKEDTKYREYISSYGPDPDTCDCGRIVPGGDCGKCQDSFRSDGEDRSYESYGSEHESDYEYESSKRDIF